MISKIKKLAQSPIMASDQEIQTFINAMKLSDEDMIVLRESRDILKKYYLYNEISIENAHTIDKALQLISPEIQECTSASNPDIVIRQQSNDTTKINQIDIDTVPAENSIDIKAVDHVTNPHNIDEVKSNNIASIFCQQCGEENGNDAKFCKSCGKPLRSIEEINNKDTIDNSEQVTTSVDINAKDDHDQKLLEAFIGKPEKIAYYTTAFKEFEAEGKKWHWSWWAAFPTILFLLHRKVYSPAVVIMILLLIPLSILMQPLTFALALGIIMIYVGGYGIIMIYTGGYGISLVHNNFQEIKNEISSRILNKDEQIEEMRRRGGFIAVWKLTLGAMILLGLYFSQDYYATQNRQNAEEYYNLGIMYGKGDGVAQDYAKAVELFTKACDGGYAGGCFNLGFMYYKGDGVAQDYAKAVELYTKACDGGSAGGCFNLGTMYDNGDGVAQDYAKAVELYTKACDGGYASGCSNLGIMYGKGDGVAQDYAKAVELITKACDGGEAIGCENLKQINANRY